MNTEILIRPEDRSKPVDPAQWTILGTFSYGGFTYSRGEPVPDMTHDELERYLRSGQIVKRLADGTLSERPTPQPKTPLDYLRAPDNLVLRAIRQHRPAATALEAMTEQARREGRALVMIEALQTILTLQHDLDQHTKARPDTAPPLSSHE